MMNFVDTILSNKFYMILTASIVIVIVFFVIKKAIKFIIYAVITLILFLAYVYYTGKSVTSAVEPVEKAVHKAGQVIK